VLDDDRLLLPAKALLPPMGLLELDELLLDPPLLAKLEMLPPAPAPPLLEELTAPAWPPEPGICAEVETGPTLPPTGSSSGSPSIVERPQAVPMPSARVRVARVAHRFCFAVKRLMMSRILL
jgi:hypothetical protein